VAVAVRGVTGGTVADIEGHSDKDVVSGLTASPRHWPKNNWTVS